MSLRSIEYIDPAVYIGSMDKRLRVAEITGGLITGFYYTDIDKNEYVFGEARIDGIRIGKELPKIDLTLNIDEKEFGFWIPIAPDGFTIDGKKRPYGFFSSTRPVDVMSLDRLIEVEFPANPIPELV